ncbi:MAG: LicD family protein [Cyanobacteria bacterium]|nr:LicD family protein [Cyanobacteriota bacterium]
MDNEHSSQLIPDWFEPVITPDEKEIFLNLLDTVVKAIHPHAYFLGAGTLLGALLFEGMIPWDDDLDIYCLFEQYHPIKFAIESSPDLECYEIKKKTENGEDYSWLKIWSKTNSKTEFSSLPWKWPFLDIFWIQQKGNDSYYSKATGITYPKDFILPLSKGCFDGKQYNIPRHPVLFSEYQYAYLSNTLTNAQDLDSVLSVTDSNHEIFNYAYANHWNHRLEIQSSNDSKPPIPFSKLTDRYPILLKTLEIQEL